MVTKKNQSRSYLNHLVLVHYRLTWNLVTNKESFMRLNLQANICRISSDLSTKEEIFRICCERKLMDSRNFLLSWEYEKL